MLLMNGLEGSFKHMEVYSIRKYFAQRYYLNWQSGGQLKI
jgi:hypothetical protein